MVNNNGGGCESLRALITSYAVETASVTERQQVEAHARDCAPCREQLARTLAAVNLACQDLVELVTDYLEGKLSPSERERFEGHLRLCEGCEIYVDQMRDTIRLTGRLTADAVQPAAKQALLGAFRDWKRG
jgi:anti-sigma factor RsiW